MKRVAVAGFGFMGMTHALNILRNKDLQLVAIIDKDLENIKKSLLSAGGNIQTGQIDAAKMENISRYSSLDECLDKEELDAVHICVHTDLHYEMTRKALLQNKHVFLEKPICLDLDMAEELISLAGEKRKILMVGHVVRFMSPYQKLKQWVDSKEFGDLQFLSLSRFSGVPAWGQWKDRQVRGTSGGALFDLVIHDIDFCNYVLGLPSEIKCSYLPGGLSNHDYIDAHWIYNEKNVHVKIEGGNIFHAGFPFQAGYLAQFEQASVQYTTFKDDVITIADPSGKREVTAGDVNRGYYDEIAYFADCMETNTQPLECTPFSSLQAVQLCYRSLQ
jgi:predicted dehydrogenase